MNLDEKILEVRHRIRQLLDHSGFSINRLAGGNSALQRKLQRQINEDATLTLDTILLLLESFPAVSPAWLLMGEGGELTCDDRSDVMVADPDDVTLIGRSRNERCEDMVWAPIYSVEASANLNTLMVGADNNKKIGNLGITGIPHIDGATYVRGDSMYPVLQSGDLIGFKVLPVSYDSIFYGEMYLLSLDVDGDNYVTVKYLQPSDLGPEYVRLQSANPNHPSKDIHLSTVRSISIVKLTIHSM